MRLKANSQVYLNAGFRKCIEFAYNASLSFTVSLLLMYSDYFEMFKILESSQNRCFPAACKFMQAYFSFTGLIG